jgi:hypothetical protein
MSGSNAWAEFAGVFARTRAAYLEHEQAKTERRVAPARQPVAAELARDRRLRTADRSGDRLAKVSIGAGGGVCDGA